MIYLATILVITLFYFYSRFWGKNINKLKATSLLHTESKPSSSQNTINFEEINFKNKIQSKISPKFPIYSLALITFLTAALFCFNYLKINIINTILSFCISFYLALFLVTLFKKYLEDKAQREVLLKTPLMLESLILLVESGLGIIPAIQQLVTQQSSLQKNRDISFLHLEEVYRLSSAGFTFSEAVKQVSENTKFSVLRHCLIHLDCSQTEGGKLIPSLINLANYSHSEWKLNSESKVRRLENLVVFPVFTAVIGLMLLVSAAPLVPLFEFGKIENNQKEIFNKSKSPGFGYVK